MSDDVEGGVDGGADTGTADQPWDLTGDAGAPGEPVEAEMVGAGWDDDGYDPERTDGGAIAALVLAIGSYLLLPLIGSVVALFLAAGAEQRISISGGALGGAGMVTAAKILAWVHLALLAILAVVFLVVLLVTAGGSDTLDLDRAEDEITASLQTEHAGVSVERVSCPDDVKVEAGAEFTCTTNVAGQPLDIVVTQEDDEGNVRFAKAQAVIPVTGAEEFIVDEYRKQGTVVTTFCAEEDQEVIVAEPGSTIECLVVPETGDGTTAVVTVTDVQGNVEIDFSPEAEAPVEG